MGNSYSFKASIDSRQVINLIAQPKLKKIPVKINYPF